MASVEEEQIIEALKGVPVPGRGADVVSLGLISGLVVKDRMVHLSIDTSAEKAQEMEPVRVACEKAAAAVSGVLSATAVLTEAIDANAPAEPVESEAGSDNLGIGAIIAVASGKGGVGKSTTTVNLALALTRLGKSVGILDADIYGPSVPRMMGIDRKPQMNAQNRIVPLENYGVKCMSMGFLMEAEDPIVWRGPMVMGALGQLLGDVEWAPLDILIVDMPPGTGDAQLTLVQQAPLAGAVIVSTPQDIALLDARKGLNMFRQVEVPILGIIENMSYFSCPHCGERTDIFDHGGARATAEQMGCDFLGEIPLDASIRQTSDGGQPIVVSQSGSEHAKTYMDIAAKIIAAIEAQRADEKTAPPNIVMQ
jgi:ATP-binding protein involved in chromosome partitioning